MTELTIHRQIKHFNICQFQHFFEDSEHVYMLLELCPNKSLGDILEKRGRLHELEVQVYTSQIVAALKYC